MKSALATILLALTFSSTPAFDTLGASGDGGQGTDDERLAFFLTCGIGELWMDGVDSLSEKLGGDKVGEMIVDLVGPVLEKANGAPSAPKEQMLCLCGIYALGCIKATNSLPFLEQAVLHGREDLRDTALDACQKIMGYGDTYLDLLDRALREGGITREYYSGELGMCYRNIHRGSIHATPENRLRIAIRAIRNPDGSYLEGQCSDVFLLADFPSYTNSVERLAALSAFLDNENTPTEVRAKYEPERDRLKALPPESLVRVTDELEAQLDALLKAAEHKRKIEQVKKYAVPASVVVLVLAVLVILFRRRAMRKEPQSCIRY